MATLVSFVLDFALPPISPTALRARIKELEEQVSVLKADNEKQVGDPVYAISDDRLMGRRVRLTSIETRRVVPTRRVSVKRRS
jgi:hypothetical protein